MTTLTDRLQKIYGEVRKQPYTETFDQFCRAMENTDFLTRSEKYIVLKLLRQWEINRGEK